MAGRATPAAAWLAALCVAACSAAPDAGASPASDALGVAVVTVGGTALDNGADDVPPTLDLRISASRRLGSSEVGTRLDGIALPLHGDGDALAVSVPPMPLGSAHSLDVALPGRPSRHLAFHVVLPAAVHAALHRDPAAGTVLDIAFALAPDRAAVERTLPPGGTPGWVDDTHLRDAWPTPPAAMLDLPASVATSRGSHLAGELRLDLHGVPAGALRGADVPEAGAPPPPLVVAFTVGTAASHASLVAHSAQIGVLSPTGLGAGADGSLTGSPDATAVDTAAAAGIPLMPVVQQLDGDTAAALCGDAAARARLVAGLRSQAAAQGWAGVNLDIENLPAGARDGLSALVAALGAGLHGDGRRLAVDVVPHRAGHLNAFSEGYDLAAIGAAADQVVLMAYEEHTGGTGPGPVAGLDWDGQLLDGSLGELGGPAKALLGVPLYGRTWDARGAETVDGYAPSLAAALGVAGARVDYDFRGATTFVRGPDGSLTYVDGAASIARKLALATLRGLAGTAMWRLGFEDPQVWALLPARAVRR